MPADSPHQHAWSFEAGNRGARSGDLADETKEAPKTQGTWLRGGERDERSLLLRPDGRVRELGAGRHRRDGKEALRCPQCGSVDHLHWLSDDARRLALKEASRRTGDGLRSPRRRRRCTSGRESLAPRSRGEAGGGRRWRRESRRPKPGRWSSAPDIHEPGRDRLVPARVIRGDLHPSADAVPLSLPIPSKAT